MYRWKVGSGSLLAVFWIKKFSDVRVALTFSLHVSFNAPGVPQCPRGFYTPPAAVDASPGALKFLHEGTQTWNFWSEKRPVSWPRTQSRTPGYGLSQQPSAT